MTLEKIISGGQTGVDQGALVAAKQFGLKTGGWMPKGFKTLEGPRPDLAKEFGLKETSSENYPLRTSINVTRSGATLRIAKDFQSPGEMSTMKFIKREGRPHMDVMLVGYEGSLMPHVTPLEVAQWLKYGKIHNLNVAGNSEKTCKGIYNFTVDFMTDVFQELRRIDR